jgi:hypothetical protein
VTTITHEQLTQTLDEVVAESPDFVYQEPIINDQGDTDGCRYEVVGSDGEPHRCLVGEILFRLLPEDEYAEVIDPVNNFRSCDDLVDRLDFLELDGLDVMSLRAAQGAQDTGRPWREAREAFYEFYSANSGTPNPLHTE